MASKEVNKRRARGRGLPLRAEPCPSTALSMPSRSSSRTRGTGSDDGDLAGSTGGRWACNAVGIPRAADALAATDRRLRRTHLGDRARASRNRMPNSRIREDSSHRRRQPRSGCGFQQARTDSLKLLSPA